MLNDQERFAMQMYLAHVSEHGFPNGLRDWAELPEDAGAITTEHKLHWRGMAEFVLACQVEQPAKEAEPDAWMWAEKKSVLGMNRIVDAIRCDVDHPNKVGVSNIRPLYLHPDVGQWQSILSAAERQIAEMRAAADLAYGNASEFADDLANQADGAQMLFDAIFRATPPSQQEDAGREAAK